MPPRGSLLDLVWQECMICSKTRKMLKMLPLKSQITEKILRQQALSFVITGALKRWADSLVCLCSTVLIATDCHPSLRISNKNHRIKRSDLIRNPLKKPQPKDTLIKALAISKNLCSHFCSQTWAQRTVTNLCYLLHRDGRETASTFKAPLTLPRKDTKLCGSSHCGTVPPQTKHESKMKMYSFSVI